MIINKETGDIQSMSHAQGFNWLGEPWILVPEELHDKALELAPFVKLKFDKDGNLKDIVDNGKRPEPEPQPDYAAFLSGILEGLHESGVDASEDYRELGQMIGDELAQQIIARR